MAEFLTVSEVAAWLRLSEKTIRKYINEKELAAYKFGKEWRIEKEEIQNFLERQRNK